MAALIGISMLGLSIAIATDMTQGDGLTWEFWIIVAVATILQPVALLAIVVTIWAGTEIRDELEFRRPRNRRRTDEISGDKSDGGPDPDGYDGGYDVGGDSGGDSGD
jgi:hypothetical protein